MNELERAATGEELVGSLDRGLQVLEVLSTSSSPLTLAEVARLCDTTRATARRLLLTLRDLELVASEEDRFRLRPKVMELGDAYLAGLRLPAVAHPHLSGLAEVVQDTCSLTVLDGFDVVYVDRVKAARIMTIDIGIGTRFPAYATSTGRVLLAGLSNADVEQYLATIELEPLTSRTTTTTAGLRRQVAKARHQGFVIADKELDESIRSIAAPVRDGTGKVIAAVNVSSHVGRTSMQRLEEEVAPRLLQTASAIAAAVAEEESGWRS